MKNYLKIVAGGLILLVLAGCEEILDPTNSKEIAASLEGVWACNEELKTTLDNFDIYISLNEVDSTKIVISNFNDLGNNYLVMATVSGYNITIPNQSMGNGFSARGTGTISTNRQTITWSYFVDDGSGLESQYEAIYTFRY